MLIRRIQSQCKKPVCCIGTSATMVSVGSTASQRSEVARVASTVFGRPFTPDQIVDETLATSLDGTGTQPSGQELSAAIAAGIDADAGEAELRQHPVAIWLENRVALEERDGRLTRRMPMKFTAVVTTLAEESAESETRCQAALEATLQWVSAVNERIQNSGSRYTLLPFKLHQFVAQTGSVYTTLDQGEDRFITLEPAASISTTTTASQSSRTFSVGPPGTPLSVFLWRMAGWCPESSEQPEMVMSTPRTAT